MIARGAVQNPWIFRETRQYLTTGTVPPEATIRERIALLLEHLRYSVRFKGERYGVIEFRKHYSGYLRSFPGIARLRADLMTAVEEEQVVEKLRQFEASIPAGAPASGSDTLAA